jgi:hypothetical protein
MIILHNNKIEKVLNNLEEYKIYINELTSNNAKKE